jgi:hypothetical protein
LAEVIRAQSCKSCKFYSVVGGGPECHRFPPVTQLFLAAVDQKGKPTFNRATTFAATEPNAWCGEYQRSLMSS